MSAKDYVHEHDLHKAILIGEPTWNRGRVSLLAAAEALIWHLGMLRILVQNNANIS